MHQWFVKRGRIGISVEGSQLLLDIDSEGAESCLLTGRDTKEVSEIMAIYAKQIWDSCNNKEEYHQLYEITTDKKYSWTNSSGMIVIGTEKNDKSIEIIYQGQNPCKISVNQAVEMIQILQYFISE